ncbi:hypothetical protein AB1K89_00915 [Sporosarcina sp. 179-K 8C2 HS]|uniref:hypothetical protein n=1 Tax=Sporosarcina sp. 179-K 8C2 HS TaxID=3142387 RepID=UPI0039A0E396
MECFKCKQWWMNRRGCSRGETGKRFNWNMIFIVPGTDDYVLIGISEKRIIHFRKGKQTPGSTIAYDEIKLDSSDVLQLAKDKFGLKQGKKVGQQDIIYA